LLSIHKSIKLSSFEAAGLECSSTTAYRAVVRAALKFELSDNITHRETNL